MSPIYISAERTTESIVGLAAKVGNIKYRGPSKSNKSNSRMITIVDVGIVVDDNPMYSASEGQLVGQYICTYNNFQLYSIIRVTGGQHCIVKTGIKKLKDCQQFAILDYCIENKLEPIKEIYYEKRY